MNTNNTDTALIMNNTTSENNTSAESNNATAIMFSESTKIMYITTSYITYSTTNIFLIAVTFCCLNVSVYTHISQKKNLYMYKFLHVHLPTF